MNEEIKKVVCDMEQVSKHTFDRVKGYLLSGEQFTIEELGKMIDIVKDSSKIMKNTIEIKEYYAEHSEKYI